jgi:signal recognition particle GTPase
MMWYRVSVSIYVKEVDENDAQGIVTQGLERAGFDEFDVDFVDLAGREYQVVEG